MQDWKRALSQAHTHPNRVLEATGRSTLPEPTARALTQSFAVRVPDYYLSLIDPNDPADPIALQCLPQAEELLTFDTDLLDAVGDELRSPVPGIVRKHENRVILLVSNTCTMYCRFCFRRPVAPGHAVEGLRDKLSQAFDYLARETRIQEVILSGGDPLTLDDESLKQLVSQLKQLPHIRLLRVHTRAPVTLPTRVTPSLVEVLREAQPLYVVTHFNHPRELSPLARERLTWLREAGIPLLNQTVLLRGVNDSVETLASLCWELLTLGVTPYYLHHCDRTPGTGPFRVSLARGQALFQALKQRLPGHGLPRYTLDIPGGLGKISLEPPYVRPLAPGLWELTSPSGETVTYPDEDEPDLPFLHTRSRELER